MRMRVAGAVFLVLLVTISGGAVYGALGDLVFERKGGAPGSEGILPAVFPHSLDVARYRCYVCQPKPFKMEAGANEITMATIGKGQFCGTCHNGQIAFNVEFQTCARCHREPAE